MLNNNRRSTLILGALAGCLFTGNLMADAISGNFFYTTFSPQPGLTTGANVFNVNYNFNGTTFTLSGDHAVALTPGADGIIGNPLNGDLLIGGQSTNKVYQITPGGVAAGSASSPDQSYALTLRPGGTSVFSLTNQTPGGQTSVDIVPISAGTLSGTGTAYTPTAGSADTDIRGIACIGTTCYYGSAGDFSTGHFGLITFNDVAHTYTTTSLLTGVHSHGLTFDPTSGDILISQGNQIQQIHISGGVASIVGTYTATTATSIDNVGVDGAGHLFAASNDGYVVFLDYDATKNIGTNSFHSEQFLKSQLDDIATTLTPTTGVPEPTSLSLIGLGLVGLRFAKKRMSKNS